MGACCPSAVRPSGGGLPGPQRMPAGGASAAPDAPRCGCALNVPSLPASLPAGCTKDWPPTRRVQLPRLAAVPRSPRLCPCKAFFPRTAPVADCHKAPNAGRSQGNWGPLMPALLPLLSLAGSVRLSSSSSLRARLTFAGWSASPSGLIWLPPHCPSHTCFP